MGLNWAWMKVFSINSFTSCRGGPAVLSRPAASVARHRSMAAAVGSSLGQDQKPIVFAYGLGVGFIMQDPSTECTNVIRCEIHIYRCICAAHLQLEWGTSKLASGSEPGKQEIGIQLHRRASDVTGTMSRIQDARRKKPFLVLASSSQFNGAD
ncbi:hypothetical protein EJB05_03207 [Eragrostis curvula]|uniref:Uncharacterized protein n=1 Tax=Eragrostis curvula TaxID=38414 RepID=A0A5J9WUK2_9POAL|nr:hypothetical protein EJB05_03207 [Eragrostis curvula]